MPAPFRFDRRFEFPVSPDALWALITRTEEFPRWWSWLREMEADGLQEGARARCVIQAPLPYSLRFTVEVDRAIAAERVETHITGDLEGPARLEISPHPRGCTARLLWNLELRDPWLRRVAFVGRPAMAWAHDRVVEIGVRQFERAAINGNAPR